MSKSRYIMGDGDNAGSNSRGSEWVPWSPELLRLLEKGQGSDKVLALVIEHWLKQKISGRKFHWLYRDQTKQFDRESQLNSRSHADPIGTLRQGGEPTFSSRQLRMEDIVKHAIRQLKWDTFDAVMQLCEGSKSIDPNSRQSFMAEAFQHLPVSIDRDLASALSDQTETWTNRLSNSPSIGPFIYPAFEQLFEEWASGRLSADSFAERISDAHMQRREQLRIEINYNQGETEAGRLVPFIVNKQLLRLGETVVLAVQDLCQKKGIEDKKSKIEMLQQAQSLLRQSIAR